MIQKKLWVPAALAGLFAVGYFGLCAYAGKQAEQRLDDFVSTNHLAGKLIWASVSSSPLGGKIVLKGVEIGDGKVVNLRASSVAVSEVIDTDSRSRWRVDAVDVLAEKGLLQGIQRIVAIGLTVPALVDFASYSPLLSSGRKELKPFELTLFVDMDDATGDLQTETVLAMPELFTFSLDYHLSNLKDLRRTLSNLNHQASASPASLPPGGVQALQGVFAAAQLNELKVGFKDNGLVRRSVLLDQRYNTPLDPAAGSADQQRKAVFEQRMVRFQKDCEGTAHQHAPMLENGCDLMVRLLKGSVPGIELNMDPKAPVDLKSLNVGPGLNQLLLQLDPKLSSL